MEGNNVRLPRESWKVVTDLLPIIKLLAVALEKPPRFYFSAEPAEIPHLVVLLVTTLRSNRRVAAGVKLARNCNVADLPAWTWGTGKRLAEVALQ